jgi:microcystin-dependent protein
MAEPFLGEIKLFGGSFAIQGWALCNGQLLSPSENDALFSLLGTTFGGDGVNTFAIPDLRGRVPVHQGNGRVMGETAGTETVTLTSQEMPMHNHVANASLNTGNAASTPTDQFWSRDPGGTIAQYRGATNGLMNPQAIGITGGSQPHDNMMPYLVINFQISLYGIYPSQG